jgi:hypothetical protein
MATSCFRIVYGAKGPLEIVDNARFGLIFKSKDELPNMLLYAFEHYSTNESKVKLRATKFDVDDFEKKHTPIISTSLKE